MRCCSTWWPLPPSLWNRAMSTLAQLSNKEAPAIVGHFHLNVTSIEAHRKFWVDTLGGRAMKFGGIDVVEFPDAFIFLHVRKPAGPTRGTAFDHIGFAVPNVPAVAMKLAAAGYQETTGREPKPGEPPAAASGTSAVYGRFAYFLGPDGVKIELVTSEDKSGPPIKYHHVHFINKQYVEMQRDMKAFGRHAASGPERLLHRRRPAGRRLQPELLRRQGRRDRYRPADGRPLRRRSRRVRSQRSGRVLQEARSQRDQADEALQQVREHGVGVRRRTRGGVHSADGRYEVK